MQKQRNFELDGRKLVAKELTVAQIHKHLHGATEETKGPTAFFDRLFPDRTPFSLVRESLGEEESFFSDVTPSEYESVLAEVEEINPFLSKMFEKIAAFSEGLLNKTISKELSVG